MYDPPKCAREGCDTPLSERQIRRKNRFCSRGCAAAPKPIPDVECAREGCTNLLTRRQQWQGVKYCCHECSTVPEPFQGPECANPDCTNRLTRRQVGQGVTLCSMACVGAMKSRAARRLPEKTWDLSPDLVRARDMADLFYEEVHGRATLRSVHPSQREKIAC